MAYDEGVAEILRTDLADAPGLAERRMFGGLTFMLDGNMTCGAYRDGGMFRVGKANMAEALAIEGGRPLAFTGRAMGGLVEAGPDVMADDARRGRLMALAVGHARSLPAK